MVGMIWETSEFKLEIGWK